MQNTSTSARVNFWNNSLLFLVLSKTFKHFLIVLMKYSSRIHLITVQNAYSIVVINLLTLSCLSGKKLPDAATEQRSCETFAMCSVTVKQAGDGACQ